MIVESSQVRTQQVVVKFKVSIGEEVIGDEGLIDSAVDDSDFTKAAYNTVGLQQR